jgi:hypothetical protein
MPWKETCAVSRRTSFVLRVLDPDREATMVELCAEYGVSRRTG